MMVGRPSWNGSRGHLCHLEKGWLSEQKIDFVDRNIAEDESALKELHELGVFSTPVTLINGAVVVGFDRGKLEQTPPEPPSHFTELSIPKSLDQLVLACLEKEPDDRPNSADELWRVLGQIEFDDPWTPERAEEWWLIHMPEHFDST